MTEKLSALRAAFVGVSALGSLFPAFAAADSAAPLPDPGAIVVPDITTSDPKVIAEGYKFFVFHNPSVNFSTAYADIAECRSFLPAGPGRAVPGFTPWAVAQPPAPPPPGITSYGLVGAAIGAIVLPKLQQGQGNTLLRRCMEPRGYVRYAVPEAVWESLNDAKNPMIIAMQAKVATGRKPPQPEVVDQ